MLLQPVRDLVVALFPQAVSARGLVRHRTFLYLRQRGRCLVVLLFLQVVSVKGMAHRTRTRV